MEQPSEKKKRRFRPFRALLKLILWLLLLVLLAFGCALLYLGMSGFLYDGLNVQLAMQPLAAEARYSFNADAQTVTIALDKSDVWWAFEETGVIDSIDAFFRPHARYYTELTGMGLNLEYEGELQMYFECTMLGFIRVPVKAVLTPSIEAERIVLRLSEVWLGNRIQVPYADILQRFKLCAPEMLYIEIDRGVHPRLNTLESIAVGDDRVLLLTCGVGDELLREAAEAEGLDRLSLYGGDSPALQLVLAGEAVDLSPLFAQLEASPAYIVEFKRQVLALSSDAAADAYFDSEYAPYAARFLPGLTRESVAQLRMETETHVASREAQLTALAAALNGAYRENGMMVGGAVLLTLEREPVDILSFADKPDELTAWLDPASMRIILGDETLADADFAGIPPLGDMVLENAHATYRRNTRARYIPVLLLQMADGAPAAAYLGGESAFRLHPLSPETYGALMQSEAMPVLSIETLSETAGGETP